MLRVSLPFLVDSFPIHSATSDAIAYLCCTRRPLCNAAFQVVHEDILSFLPFSLSRLHKDFKQWNKCHNFLFDIIPHVRFNTNLVKIFIHSRSGPYKTVVFLRLYHVQGSRILVRLIAFDVLQRVPRSLCHTFAMRISLFLCLCRSRIVFRFFSFESIKRFTAIFTILSILCFVYNRWL